MRIIVARSHSGLMSAPLMLACLFPLPNHAAASAAHCIPTKEGSASRRGSPCLSSPALFPFVLAVSPPLLAAHAKWQTALTAAASVAAGRTEHGVLAQRILQGSRRPRVRNLLSRGTAFWKPGPCLTMRMRESKLRKGMLCPQGLFCVGARRGDSKPGDLCPLHHVNPETFFRYPTVPLTCRTSLAELPEPSCPCLLAHIGLSSGRRCACRRGFNRLSGLHSSLSLALPLGCWQLIYSQHCAVVSLWLWEPVCQILLISLLTSCIWCIQRQPEAVERMLLRDGCLVLVEAHRSGWQCRGRTETRSAAHIPRPIPRPMSKLPAPDTDVEISPGSEGFTLLSVHPPQNKDSLKWEGISRPSLADFWSVLNAAWQIGESLWGGWYWTDCIHVRLQILG